MAKMKIMLDAGHYGKINRSPADPNYYESLAMWDLHLHLKEALERCGFTVATTRAKQTDDLDVYYRGAKGRGYDLVLSLHSNTPDNSGRVNNEIDRPVIIHYYDADEHDKALAQKLGDKIRELIGAKQKTQLYTKQSGSGEWYGVLRGAKAVGCPTALIIEHGFHTCRQTVKYLLPANGKLPTLAEEEAKVICAHYGVKYVAPGEEEKPEPKPEPSKATFKKGDLVSIKKGAKYYDGTDIPDWVEADKWYVESVSGDRVVINQNEKKTNSIMSPVAAKYLTLAKASTPEKKPAAKKTLKVGSLVTIKKGSKYYGTAETVPSWVCADKWYVEQIKGERVVVNQNVKKTNAIMSAVYKTDVTVVG